MWSGRKKIALLILVFVHFSHAGGSDVITESIIYPSSQPEITLSLGGVYEKRDIPYHSRYPNGVEVDQQHTIVTFKPLDQAIYGKSSLIIGEETISQNQKTIPFFLIGKFPCYDEFSSLLGKKVHIEGTLEQSNDLFFHNVPQIHLHYVVDYKWATASCETFPYEPNEVTLEGKLYQATYPDSSMSMILALAKPIHVGNDEDAGDDEFSEPEKYVLELIVNPPDDALLASMLNRKVKVQGTLFHAHTVHHHRRVLCDAKFIEILE